jgi:hypothetical protein
VSSFGGWATGSTYLTHAAELTEVRLLLVALHSVCCFAFYVLLGSCLPWQKGWACVQLWGLGDRQHLPDTCSRVDRGMRSAMFRAWLAGNVMACWATGSTCLTHAAELTEVRLLLVAVHSVCCFVAACLGLWGGGACVRSLEAGQQAASKFCPMQQG